MFRVRVEGCLGPDPVTSAIGIHQIIIHRHRHALTHTHKKKKKKKKKKHTCFLDPPGGYLILRHPKPNKSTYCSQHMLIQPPYVLYGAGVLVFWV